MGTQASAAIDLFRRFRPTSSQRRFLESTARNRLFSSGYGSGKSKTGCREAIAWAVQYPGCRGLIGRQVADELKTSTMVTFWKEMSTIGLVAGKHYTHNKADREIIFWNESSILYRHLDDPDALGSQEFNFAFIDEGAEVSDDIYKTISSSRLRWHLPECELQKRIEALLDAGASDEEIADLDCTICPRGIWVCTNPGASGYLRAVTRGKADGWEWIPAKPGDNPYNGREYYEKMERDRQMNGDVWMKKFYEGDWTAFEGQRFTMFDSERHVLSVPWRPTDAHQIVEGWDFGHRETFVTWMAYHPKMNEPVVVFAELQVNEVKEPHDVADEVKRIRAEYRVDPRTVVSLGDPAGTGASQFSAVSPISAYAGLGLFIAPCKAGKSPTARADLLTAFLNETRRQPDGSLWPGIVFSPSCPAVVESILSVQWKKQTSRAGEDPREQFLKKDDHGFDSCSYGLVGVPEPVFEKPKPVRLGRNVSIQEALAAQGF